MWQLGSKAKKLVIQRGSPKQVGWVEENFITFHFPVWERKSHHISLSTFPLIFLNFTFIERALSTPSMPDDFLSLKFNNVCQVKRETTNEMERAHWKCPPVPLGFIPCLIDKRCFGWTDSQGRWRHGPVSHLFILQSCFQAKTSSWLNNTDP